MGAAYKVFERERIVRKKMIVCMKERGRVLILHFFIFHLFKKCNLMYFSLSAKKDKREKISHLQNSSNAGFGKIPFLSARIFAKF